MVETHRLNSIRGCLNPLCPRANWHEAHLPRWWVRLDDGQVREFAACDDGCAQAAVRLLQTQLGRGGQAATLVAMASIN